MSDMSTEDRNRLDAILDSADDYRRAAKRCRKKARGYEYSADYYCHDEAQAVVAARDRFGAAMRAWFDAEMERRKET